MSGWLVLNNLLISLHLLFILKGAHFYNTSGHNNRLSTSTLPPINLVRFLPLYLILEMNPLFNLNLLITPATQVKETPS